MQQVLPYGEEAILVHCTTLHAGLLSRCGTAGSGQEEGRLRGACPHSQIVSDGRRGWGTPAGLPRSGSGRRNSENVAVPAGHRPRLELELSPRFWCPHCSCDPQRVQPCWARYGYCRAAIVRSVCSHRNDPISNGEGSGKSQPRHSLICW